MTEARNRIPASRPHLLYRDMSSFFPLAAQLDQSSGTYGSTIRWAKSSTDAVAAISTG